ncbi:MAG: UDP-glucose 4-epimerase GalE [Smithella sp.]|nr:UDP-glucose 4-epimerase GalE [Smithella sp.]
MTGSNIKRQRHSESTILVTGGTGYIGSHTVVALMQEGYCPVIVDNLSNSKISVLKRIGGITGREPTFYKADLLNTKALNKIFQRHRISSVIHFAGLKAVGESVLHPLQYYRNNIEGSLSLFSVMSENDVKKIIFSSSASIYGQAAVIPIAENCPPAPTNPYARSKFIIEQILNDIHRADPQWEVVILRYFNPVGAHQSGLIGEDPQGIPNNLMPYISQVAVGRRKKLQIFGNDYPTSDGTGVRDYIHVMDLAEGHVAALRKIEKKQSSRKKKMPLMINLGTGRGCTVMEMVQAFEKVSGKKIPYSVTKRRAGDIAACYADVTYAKKILKWKTKRSIEDMCCDAWRWQSENPQGY